ncbi:MAG TPA: hypothetical protein VL981_06780, partial [Candidatus Methylacidiphilales bacterium]|nr:hypothetical protein [Candidatus Methylacidiphilales bacterium]
MHFTCIGPTIINKSPLFFKEAVVYSGLILCAGGVGFVAQSVFSRCLAAGEFGALSTTLGIIALLGVPLAAVNQALTHYLARYHANDRQEEIDQFRQLAFEILKITASTAGLLAIVTMLILPKIFPFGRPLLGYFALLGILGYLGTTLSSALCLGLNRFRLWGILIIGAACIRLVLAALMAPRLPWAETGMAITALAGLITTVPLFHHRKYGVDAKQALRIIFQRDFFVYLAASFSVMLALFCFVSGDQVVARHSFSPKFDSSHATFNARGYDDYQAAGMLGRELVWASAPVLAVMFTQVSRLPAIHLSGPAVPALFRRQWHALPVTKALELLLLYVAMLYIGAMGLIFFRTWLTWLFQGRFHPDTA